MSKKVLVTGGTGLVGSHLIKLLLKENYKVKAVKRATSNLCLIEKFQDQVQWVIGDILDVPFLEEIIEDVDWVFHCAAIVSFSPKERKKMYDINVTGTANIVNICLHHNTKKLIYTSSIAAIGRPERQIDPISENTKWVESPLNSEYGKSKFKAEMEVWRGYAEGLSIAIVNPSIILGKGHWDNGSSKLFMKVKNGLKFFPKGSTGFVDVRDVVETMLSLAEKDINGQRYILNGTNTSYQNFLNLVAKHLNVESPSIPVNQLIQSLAWRFEKFRSFITSKHPLVTKETAKLSSLSYQYDNQKSIELGISYRSLEDTVEHTCQYLID